MEFVYLSPDSSFLPVRWKRYGDYRVYRWKEVRETASVAWHRKQMFYRSGAYEQAAEVYAEIYEDMKWNARYLFEYGHALHKLHRHEESNVVMKEALRVSGDPMILNIIGKNEQEAGNYAEAEYWLIRSTHRLPGRIYPYFLLAKLYAEPEFYQREKLEQAARMVMEKEPKVQSTVIRQMRGNKEADRQRVKPMFFHPIPFVRRAIRYCFFTAVKNSF